MWRMLERMSKGDATKDEVDMLGDVTNQIAGHTICAFGEGSSWPVQGLLISNPWTGQDEPSPKAQIVCPAI